MYVIELHGSSMADQRYEVFIGADSLEAAEAWLLEKGFGKIGDNFRRNKKTEINCDGNSIVTPAVWADITELRDPSAVQFSDV